MRDRIAERLFKYERQRIPFTVYLCFFKATSRFVAILQFSYPIHITYHIMSSNGIDVFYKKVR